MLLFQVVTVKLNPADEVDLEDFVSRPDKISGDEIVSICQEAGMQALRTNRSAVLQSEFETAYKEDVQKDDQDCAFYKQ